jgi:hypothetical protein
MSILRYGKKILSQGGVLMGGGKGGGGGGGQQQVTQQSNQYASLSPWAQPFITSILGAGQSQVFKTDPTTGNITGINPYNAYGSYNPEGGQYGINPSAQAAANAAVAGFTPLQQQAYQGASGLNLPNQFGPATGAALQGTGQALMAGQNYQNMATNPYATAAYMNPYLQASLQPQLNMIAQQGGIQGAQQQGAATQAGAFGGSRNALQQALTQQNTLLAQQQAIGQGYNQAFQAAQQAQQYGAGLGLQGSQAGIAGAGQLGNLGTAQLAAQQGILGLQNQFGGQQQQQAQNVINAGMTNYQTAQQYPMTQLSQLKNLISGIPITDVTTTQQQAQPSAVTQLAGLGTAGVAGLAMANKAAEGGLMDTKRMASGGIASLNRKALLAPETMSPQTLQRSTQNGAIAPQVSGIAKAIQLNEQVNAKNADALSKPPAQGTIMDELEAKASAMDQEEMIPKAMAVLKHKMDQAIEEGDMPLAKRYAAELQQLYEIAKGQQSPIQQSAPAPEGIEQALPQVQQVAGTQPQGIESAPTNLPTQTMAEGGIATFSSRGYVDQDEYQTKEEAEDAELQQLFGTGSDNDFVQAVAARGKQSEISPSAGIKIKSEPVTAAGKGHKYEADVIKEAKRIGLPENIALHALYKETGGLKDPETARSKAGAIGIMQLMPATAKELGVNPHDPMENIQGGVGYLKKMYDKYQDPRLTLMAYNAGPGRVDRALRSRQGLASLPLETRNYKEGGVIGYDDGGLTEELGIPELSSSSLMKKPLRSYVPTMGEINKILSGYQPEKETPVATPVVSQPLRNDNLAAKPVAVAPVVNNSLQPDSLGRYSVTPIGKSDSAPIASETTPQFAAIKQAQSEVSGGQQPDIYQELISDIKSRKEESKKQREQNNLLALMQAGLGVAASKNIHPLGAIGEGGMQGIGTLAQLRKEEGQEAKDIAAQQLGLYKYQTAAQSAAAQLAETKRGHDLAYGGKDESLALRNQALFEKAYETQAKAIDARAAAALKSLGVEVLPEELQKQFDAQKQQAYKQLRESYKLPKEPSIEYTPIRTAIPTLKPTVKQRLPEALGGLSKADMDAIDWANKNPYDPKALEVKKRLGL